jgi:hypothetical protein
MTKKPKILTRLRIDEVSSVDRGAGDGVKILLMKRHNDTEQPRTSRAMTFDEVMEKHERTERQRLFYTDFEKYVAGHEGDEIEEIPEPSDTVSTLPAALEGMVAALIAANPKLKREEAIHFLVHNPHGRRLAEHISSITKGTTDMSRTEQLQEMAKSAGGVRNVAKFIAEKNDALGISEPELTDLINAEAQKTIKAGERPAQAFSRFFQAPENEELRRAIIVAKTAGHVGYLQTEYAKSYPREAITEPRVVSGADATDVNGDRDEAIKQMNELAERQRTISPFLSFAQCFARVMADPANSDLAMRALQPPGQSMSGAAGENRQ